MTVVFLILTTTCLATTQEPPLGDATAAGPQRMPVGEPLPQPAPAPVTVDNPPAGRIAPMPVEPQPPSPKRSGWFRGLFHHSAKPAQLGNPVGPSSSDDKAQPANGSSPKRFGWFRGLFRSSR
jgi:hypothetical protein